MNGCISVNIPEAVMFNDIRWFYFIGVLILILLFSANYGNVPVDKFP